MSERGPDPLISIALCTFNGAGHLREQLDSLLSQSHRNVEIVAVDDCSSDATVTILQDYQRRDARLRVMVNASNLGFKRNFAFAIAQCRGDFIAPSDQDDIWYPDKLRDLFAVIGDNTMAYCDSELIDAQSRPLNKAMSDWWRMQDTRDPLAFVMDNCVSGHAMLFRRELLGRALPIPGDVFHDWWLTAVAASLSGVAYLPKKLVRYRQHGGNVTDVLRDRRNALTKRPAGVGLRRIEDIGNRLRGLAALPSAHQPLLIEWHRLWLRHFTQWFSWRLAAFMIAHRLRIFALSRRSKLKILLKAATYVFGVRTLRLIKNRKYTL
jgi:glycosyltransferase involved in cell wall biosynthesis